MRLKTGRVRRDDTPKRNAKIRRLLLDTGEHVYVPRDACGVMFERYSPADTLYFLESGWLGRASWVGRLFDLKVALASGTLSARDVPWETLPTDDPTPDGWIPVARGNDHLRVAGKAADVLELMDFGNVDEAIEAWSAGAREEGCCLVRRFDHDHGEVSCIARRGHAGPHVPECPGCEVVSLVLKTTYLQAGQWQ